MDALTQHNFTDDVTLYRAPPGGEGHIPLYASPPKGATQDSGQEALDARSQQGAKS